MTQPVELLQEIDAAYNTSADIQHFAASMISKFGYSNVEMAVLRENANNAYDGMLKRAHTEGVDVSTLPAIEVTLPDRTNDFTLTITDHGSGMTMEETQHYHGGIWNSDKRNDDRFSGDMGIGSKSGHAVSDVITVNTVKDGMRSIVMYEMKEDGKRTITPLFHDTTDASNGTTIEIPVRNADVTTDTDKRVVEEKWQTEARVLFQWWDPTSFTITNADGEKYHATKIIWLNERIGITLNQYTGYNQLVDLNPHHYIRMGHTMYPLPDEEVSKIIDNEFWSSGYYRNIGKTVSLIFNVPNKSMKALTSRESLVFNESARKLLAEYGKEAKTLIRQHNQKLFDTINLKKRSDQLLLIGEIRGKDYTYKGESLGSQPSSMYAETWVTYKNNIGVPTPSRQYYDEVTPIAAGFDIHRQILVTNCGDTDLDLIRDAYTWFVNQLDKSEQQVFRVNSKATVHFKVAGPEGWEKHFEFRMINNLPDILKSYDAHLVEVKKEEAAKRKAAREEAKLRRASRPQGAPRKVRRADQFNVYSDFLKSEERRCMTIEEIKEAKPKLLYVTTPGMRNPDYLKFYADRKYRLIVTSKEDDIKKTMDELKKARLKPFNLTGNRNRWHYQVDLERRSKEEFRWAGSKIRNVIDENDLDEYIETQIIARLQFIMKNSSIEFKNKQMKSFADEIALRKLPRIATSGPLYTNQELSDSRFTQWAFEHTLLFNPMNFTRIDKQKWADDMMTYINAKNIKI